MKTKLLISFIAVLTLNLSLLAGDRGLLKYDKNVRQQDAFAEKSYIPYNVNPESIVFVAQLADGFETDSLSVGPEISTLITGFYDYKTNGESNIYIQVSPTNSEVVQVIDVQADSLDFAGSTTRRTKYSFTTNGGQSWDFNVDVPEVRSGFGVLHLTSTGAAVISNHSTNVGGVLDANLYVDIDALAGTFTEYGHPTHSPFGIWPQIALLSNGNIGLISRRNVSTTAPPETLYYSYWNQTVLSTRIPLYITGTTYAGNVGSNMRFHLASNGAGRVTAIIAPVNQIDTLDNSMIFQRTSIDDGANWGPVTPVFRPYTVNGDQDTVASAGGSGFIYKKNSDMWFLAYPITTDNLYEQARLVVTRSDGNTSIVATAAQLGATASYAQSMSFVFNIDFPSMGWSADGSTLYCVYSVTMPDTSRGYNQRDIFCSYSLDNAATWSNPIRITNTTDIDETYPSVSFWNPGTPGNPYELHITYMKDPGVGPSSFGGSAPATRNTLIYRKFTALPPIGIINNQNLLKEYRLTQNYPNPFNPSTKIEYNIIKSGLVTLKVYDVLGREVRTLVNEVQTSGVKEIEFNAAALPSGIYFYTLSAGDFTNTKKMILIK